MGSISISPYFIKKAEEHGKSVIQANYLYVKKILKDEFEYGTLSADNIEHRLDELMDLDTSSIKYDVLDKGYDTSLIKTPEDIQDFLEVTFEGKSDQSFNKEYRQKVLFEKCPFYQKDYDTIKSKYELKIEKTSRRSIF